MLCIRTLIDGPNIWTINYAYYFQQPLMGWKRYPLTAAFCIVLNWALVVLIGCYLHMKASTSSLLMSMIISYCGNINLIALCYRLRLVTTGVHFSHFITNYHE